MRRATRSATSKKRSRQSADPPEYQLVITWSEQDRVFIAEVPELQGCRTHGATAEQAARSGREAMALWIEDELAHGRALPPPQRGRSGTLSLRLPKSLHEKVARRAAREGVSTNQWIVARLAEEEGARARHD